MSKNETLKKIRTKLAVLDQKRDTLAADGLARVRDEIEPLFPHRERIEQGQEIVEFSCPKCGAVRKETGRIPRIGRSITCPECGYESHNVSNFDRTKSGYVLIPVEDPDLAGIDFFVEFQLILRAEFGHEMTVSLGDSRIGAFSPETGVRLKGAYTDKVYTSKSIPGHEKAWFPNTRYVVTAPDEKDKILGLFEAEKEYQAVANTTRKASPKPKKPPTQPKNDERLEFPLKELSEFPTPNIAYVSDACDDQATSLFIFNGHTGETSLVNQKCSKYNDNKTFMVNGEIISVVDVIWPGNRGGVSEYFVYEDTGNLTKRFLVRRYVETSFSMEDGKIIPSAREILRQYMLPDKIWEYEVHDGIAVPMKRKTKPYGYYVSDVQKRNEIKAVVSRTEMSRCGFMEALDAGMTDGGNTNVYHFSTGCYCGSNYLDVYYEQPGIESLVKIGLTNFVGAMISRPETRMIDSSQRKAHEMLGLPSKAALKVAGELNLTPERVKILGSVADLEPDLVNNGKNRVVLTRILNTPDIGRVIAASREFGIKIQAILNYLKTCDDHQAIPEREAIGIWTDYYRMARLLHYDLKDRSRRFPRCLKMEHDIATRAYDAVREEKQDPEKFKVRYEAMKKYEYQCKELGLMSIAPKSAEEIVGEGRNLEHCVKSYVGQVMDGKTMIMFIRHIEDPEQSYYTIEIKDGKVEQLRGLRNCPPTQDVVNFVSRWTINKHIQYTIR